MRRHRYRASVMASLLVAATLGLVATVRAASPRDALEGYRWKARVLVLSAPGTDDPRLVAQREALASARAGTAERALVVVEAVGQGAEASALRRRLGLPEDVFRAVLVGKDGGAKLSAAEPIPPQRLFATIDAMPMRRDEMRGR